MKHFWPKHGQTWTVPGRQSGVEAHRAMQPWIDGPRRTRCTRGTPHLTMLDASRCIFRCIYVGVRRSKTLRRVNLTPTSSPWVGYSPTHREDVVVKFMAPVYHRCLFVGDPSLRAECGSHTPWHALAHASEILVSQGFMQDMDWIWCLHFLAYRIVMPWSHPRRNESDDCWCGRRRRPSCLHRRWEDDGYLVQHLAASLGTAV